MATRATYIYGIKTAKKVHNFKKYNITYIGPPPTPSNTCKVFHYKSELPFLIYTMFMNKKYY